MSSISRALQGEEGLRLVGEEASGIGHGVGGYSQIPGPGVKVNKQPPPPGLCSSMGPLCGDKEPFTGQPRGGRPKDWCLGEEGGMGWMPRSLGPMGEVQEKAYNLGP
jgi:hypothetical protein